MAGRANENLPGGSLKYLFVYFNIRILTCSYRSYRNLNTKLEFDMTEADENPISQWTRNVWDDDDGMGWMI